MPSKRGVLVSLAILLGAALGTATVTQATTPASSIDVAVADNAFGFRLLGAIQTKAPTSNVVLSPVSAALNLSMVLNGASDATRQEILTTLSLSVSGSDLAAINEANAQLIKVIRTPTDNVTLSIADSLWVDSRRATLQPDYVQYAKASYDAEMIDLDFSDLNAVARINSWAAKETHDKIPKVIDRLGSADLLLLLNAVYFKGQWTHKFDKAQTQERGFALDGGGATRQVPRMSQAGRFDYFETPQLQAIRLPFGAGDLVMDVLLPAKSSSLKALEADLTTGNWAAWRAQFASHPGTIELPRFELKSSYRLNDPLQTLGMTRAFQSERAQFTGMFAQRPGQRAAPRVFISSVLQSTYWKVDEEGATAAAVTTTGIRAAVARPEQRFEMIVDRPFFCAIEDRRSGVLLFVAAIYDPTS
jgi:serine protease inhibitor